MKTVLVIGGMGQDGCYLARLLLARGDSVHVTTRRDPATPGPKPVALGIAGQVGLHSLEPARYTDVARLIAEVAPDEIYNLGGMTSVSRSLEDPLGAFDSIASAAINVLEAVRKHRPETKLFNPASSEIFGSCKAPATTETPLRPLSPYGAAKAAAYHAFRTYRTSYGLFAVNGILFNHESPLRDEHFVTAKIVRQAVEISRGERRKLRLGNLSGARDWGWAPESVEAMRLSLEASKPDDYIVATGVSHTLEAFTVRVFETLGLEWRDHVEHDPALLRPADIEASLADPSATEAALGWRAACSFEELVERLVAAELDKRKDTAP